MKLVADLALGAAIVTLGEALSLGESLELQRSVLLDVLADSPIGPIVKAKRANVESGQFAPSFRLRCAAKDHDSRILVSAALALRGAIGHRVVHLQKRRLIVARQVFQAPQAPPAAQALARLGGRRPPRGRLAPEELVERHVKRVRDPHEKTCGARRLGLRSR